MPGLIGMDWSFVAGVIYLLNTLFAIVVIFFERRNPTATLAWLMVLFFLPLIGFVLYLFLGQNYTRQRLFTLKAKDDAALRAIFE
ncbi:MAG TPA: PLDc N-terminal domain-containing protein, partial [Methanoculleus sp.]|nr:PLDc N-terminal domain-containing protein [Methanoculleus sp.]